jgi:hypothetical protein
VLTWIFDINRGGIERTLEAGALLPGERIVRRVFEALGVLLSVLFALAVAWWMLS